MTNLIMLSDSYKLSHYKQYPPEMTAMQSYLEARGGEYKDIVFYGLDWLIKDYIYKAIELEDIEQAHFYANKHGLPFNREGWEYIFGLGYLPVKITAKPEGSICYPGEPLLTIESTDPNCAWLVNYLETLLMKVWYPCTVASKAYAVRKIIEKWYDKAGLPKQGVDFAYHNFGDRGSSSPESAMVGGAAHLTSFKGTDNFNSLCFIDSLYINSFENIGFSIPATEHSTVTSWGKEREFKMIENHLEGHKGMPMIACVLDSYNIYNAVEFVTTKLKSRIESSEYPTFVIRPDSGNPLEVIASIFSIMESNKVAFTMQGEYKLFNKYRIIWGDGIDPAMVDKILELVVSLGYSPANLAFGSGGDLMQKLNRDTSKYAMKLCAVKYKGSDDWKPVFKEPLHDGFKKSKGGFQTVQGGMVYYEDGEVYTADVSFHDIRRKVIGG